MNVILESLLLLGIFCFLAYMVVKLLSLTRKINDHVALDDPQATLVNDSWMFCGHASNLWDYRGVLEEIALELGEDGPEYVSCGYNVGRGSADFVTDTGEVIARVIITEVVPDAPFTVLLWSNLPKESKDVFARRLDPLPIRYKNFSF